jgi:Lon protease-like protein
MFPLGTVLFPHMPLSLHVFEERYRRLVGDCLEGAERGEPPEFGVVLIERGQEVGGGEQRFGRGTVARITEVGRHEDGRYSVVAVGTRRVDVRAWLPDDPYPLADTDAVADPPLDGDDDIALLARADRAVRRCLTLKAELDEPAWPAAVVLDADPSVAMWQLAAIAPLGPIDQLELLALPTPAELLTRLGDLADDEASVLYFRLGSG